MLFSIETWCWVWHLYSARNRTQNQWENQVQKKACRPAPVAGQHTDMHGTPWTTVRSMKRPVMVYGHLMSRSIVTAHRRNWFLCTVEWMLSIQHKIQWSRCDVSLMKLIWALICIIRWPSIEVGMIGLPRTLADLIQQLFSMICEAFVDNYMARCFLGSNRNWIKNWNHFSIRFEPPDSY